MAQYSFEHVKDDYTKLWSKMTVVKVAAANQQAQQIIKNKKRYKNIEGTTTVPWFVVGCLHMRESNGDFNTWMHNGDPMRDKKGKPVKTVHVPKNRPINPNCTFEEGAYDALVTIEHLDQIKDWGPERCAYAMEKFNGFGYRNPTRDIPSPYLWGGTSVQQPGKFISDGHYDAHTIDPQIGGMAVLKQLMALDPEACFEVVEAPPPPPPPPPPKNVPPPLSPRADDTTSGGLTNPASQSRTVVGAVLTWVASAGTSLFSIFQYLSNPYALAAFVFVILIASVGLYLTLTGRLQLTKLVEHLAEDD
jgi:lysozyme family protein